MKEKIKNLIDLNNKEGNGKKKIENLVVFIIILIITIIIINSIWNEEDKTEEETESTNTKQLASTDVSTTDTVSEESDLEQKLEEILKTITGVGDVKVFINYSESSSLEVMYNESVQENLTEETDSSGGVRTIQETTTQKEVIYSEEDGNKTPVTQKITMPTIEGAIVTAEGAGNATIKTNIIEAISAVTGLGTHKIQVFEMSK